MAIRVDPKVLESYVGQYQFETLQNRISTVTREGDRLFVTLPSKTELFPESESKFFLKTRPYKFVFTRADGPAAQLEVVEGGATFSSKRIEQATDASA